MVILHKIPVKSPCEQEECVEMETCDMSLPKMFKAKERVKMPKINEMEVNNYPES